MVTFIISLAITVSILVVGFFTGATVLQELE